jgi:heme/copper-type cytochrome/quinol oxidase subunit 1
MVQDSRNPGLFEQPGNGFLAIENPIAASSWLLTKNVWWLFVHPVVYFPLLIFLDGIYFFTPRYGKERVAFDKWNYRS